MAQKSIWNGSSNFQPGQTPFGFYDLDPDFSSSADKVAHFCAVRLGYPLMDVELSSGSFYACFEEAVTTYGNEVYQSLAVQNYLALEGGDRSELLNNTVISSNLETVIRISQNYGTEAGVGGPVTLEKGSIDLIPGVQEYDLKDWAVSQSISGGIEIRRVFYEAPPAILRYFDPYAGTGTGIQSLMDAFDFGSYSPGVNFLLMPASYDVLKTQAIEFNDQIRKSAFSFEIHNNNLRLLPVPTREGKIWFEYYKVSDKGSISSLNVPGNNGNPSGSITNISNVPFDNPTYSQINSIGKQWIFRYALALAKELLGYIRGKYSTIPIPGAEATLNQSDLLSDARTEKEALILNLREILDQTSKVAQLERKSNETRFTNEVLKEIPMTIYVG